MAQRAVGRKAVPAAAGAAGENKPANEGDDSIFMPASRQLLRMLSQAEDLLKQQRYAEAVHCLGTILEGPEDYFFKRNRQAAVHTSLKSEAQRLVGQMPAPARELYEMQYGAQARQMLQTATATGNAATLGDISRRFFHTTAGYEATYLLGLYHWDHASPLAAALVFKRLREAGAGADQFEPGLSLVMAAAWARAGMPEQQAETLASLRKRHPQGLVSIGGKETSLSADLASLWKAAIGLATQVVSDQWVMFRGNATRNLSTSGTGPLLSLAWRVPTTEHPYLEMLIEQWRQTERNPEQASFSAFQPLVINDTVLMRTAKNLLAVNLVTGKRLWEVPCNDPFEAVFSGNSTNPDEGANAAQVGSLGSGIRLRMWGDATYGTLSSDGQLVFAVEDLPLENRSDMPGIMFNGRRGAADGKGYNRLAAYDIRTGKLVWHLGGSPELGLPLAGTFFLGPPLPLTGQLYVIGESKGEIRLLTLDPRNQGRPIWTQQLAMVDQERDASTDLLRRMTGASPSYSDGVLVCPTSNRSIVALELATRSLLWGFVYGPGNANGEGGAVVPFGIFRGPSAPEPSTRWTDSSLVVAEGRVLATPVDSGDLHCLRLLDGKFLWSRPRQDAMYLACVYKGKVILVGRQGVRALGLEDGKPLWNDLPVKFPVGGIPSGTGFANGPLYYIPLTSEEVLVVDMEQGKTVHSYRSRRGVVPGNLVATKDRILSQRVEAVESFFQLEVLQKEVQQRLAAHPDDPKMLAQRGEILWDAGKLKEAIGCFHRSLEREPSVSVRTMLRDAYFDGLKTEFAEYRVSEGEIRKLIDEPAQEGQFLRLMAAGLEGVGQPVSALEHYLKLLSLNQKPRELDTITRGYRTRQDRWLQGQLNALCANAQGDARAALDRAVQSRFETAVKEDTVESLEQFLTYFGGQPIAQQTRRRLLAKAIETQQYLRAEMLLRSWEGSSSVQDRGWAMSELASMLRQAGQAEDAAVCYARLQRDFAEVACRDGKTGAQLAQSLPAEDPVAKALRDKPVWPPYFEVLKGGRRNGQVSYAVAIPLAGSRGPFFGDLAVEMRQHPSQELVAYDGFGAVRWQIPAAQLMRRERFGINQHMARVIPYGHLFVIALGPQIVAIDPITGGGKPPRVLWTQDVDDAANSIGYRVQRGNVMIFNNRILRAAGMSVQASMSLPIVVTEHTICYPRSNSLVGIDPTTGELVWSREDMRPGSAVFGDGDYLFVVSPPQNNGTEENQATVLRTLDGKSLGARPLPPSGERLAIQGREILRWREDDGHMLLERTDVWNSKLAWPAKKFAPGAKICLLDDRLAGVYESKGRFSLVQLSDGKVLAQNKLEADESVTHCQLMTTPSGYLFVLNSPKTDSNNNEPVGYSDISGMMSVQIDRARVYGFDPSGKMLWEKPTLVQSQRLPLNQSPRLPVVMFACMVHRQKPSPRQELSFVFLDTRTGQTKSQVMPNEAHGSLHITGDPVKKAIRILSMDREFLTLQFADKPGEAKPSTPKTSNALWDALEKAGKRVLQLPDE